jgi:hypothetical protein
MIIMAETGLKVVLVLFSFLEDELQIRHCRNPHGKNNPEGSLNRKVKADHCSCTGGIPFMYVTVHCSCLTHCGPHGRYVTFPLKIWGLDIRYLTSKTR